MDEKKIQEALENLDMSEVAFKLSQMALKAISGKKIEEKESIFNKPSALSDDYKEKEKRNLKYFYRSTKYLL